MCRHHDIGCIVLDLNLNKRYVRIDLLRKEK